MGGDAGLPGTAAPARGQLRRALERDPPPDHDPGEGAAHTNAQNKRTARSKNIIAAYTDIALHGATRAQPREVLAKDTDANAGGKLSLPQRASTTARFFRLQLVLSAFGT